MNIKLTRSELFKVLQTVIGVVERRQSLPILANVLLSARDDVLTVCASDLELEIQSRCQVQNLEPGRVAAPGRKLFDICRGLPEDAEIELKQDGSRLRLECGRGRFVLSTMPADDFPLMASAEDDGDAKTTSLRVPSGVFKELIQKTQFAMAQQDVRYYLNGLLLDFGPGHVRAVATDGHRLALSDLSLAHGLDENHQLILPRKTVLELMRLLEGIPDEVSLRFTENQIEFELNEVKMTSKVIDGRFPDYERVVPKDGEHRITANRGKVKAALARAAILSNEKFRGVRLDFGEGVLRIQAQNPQQEEADEEVEVEHTGVALEIGFNVNYLLDALNAMDGELFAMEMRGPDASGLIHDPEMPQHKFVVMPLRL